MNGIDTRHVKDERSVSRRFILMRNIRNWLPLIKSAAALVLGATLGGRCVGAAQTLYDDFSGSQINASIWQVQLPFSLSSVTESGGCAVLKGRGQLIPNSSFLGSPTGILDIRGSFAFTGGLDDFLSIVTRTDGTIANEWGMVAGVSAYFDPRGLMIQNGDVSGTTTIATAAYTFEMNTYYDFRVTDDGSHFAIYISDLNTPVLAATDTYSVGNRVAIYDRESYGGYNQNPGINFDYISIAVPEPGSFALIGLGLASAWHFGRKGSPPRLSRRRVQSF
jgi:hypothetical protein